MSEQVTSSATLDTDDPVKFLEKLLRLQRTGEVKTIQVVYTDKDWQFVHVNIDTPDNLRRDIS